MAEEESTPLGEENEEELNEEELQEEEHDDASRAVASSMVASWGYNREAEQLEVFFLNGHSDTYSISPDQWEEAKTAVSPGQWMHQNVL